MLVQAEIGLGSLFTSREVGYWDFVCSHLRGLEVHCLVFEQAGVVGSIFDAFVFTVTHDEL